MQNQVRDLFCNKQFKIKFFHSILLQRHATGGSDVEQRWRQRSVSLVQVSSSHPLTPTIFASSFAQAKRFVFVGIVGARKKEVQSIIIPRLPKPLHYTVNIRMSASVCVQLIFVGKLNARLILFLKLSKSQPPLERALVSYFENLQSGRSLVGGLRQNILGEKEEFVQTKTVCEKGSQGVRCNSTLSIKKRGETRKSIT